MSHLTSERLYIGGLDFRFSPALSWLEGPLFDYYKAFLSKPASPITLTDEIAVELHAGVPVLSKIDQLVEDGASLRWYTVGSERHVEKVLPDVSTEPLWRIVFHPERSAVDLYFSDLYLAGESLGENSPFGVPRYPIDQLMVIDSLATRQGVLVHSAGIRCGNRGFVCPGVSGAGKTTLSRLLASHGAFDILTDDRAVLRVDSKGVRMHGTPWSGEGRHATAGMAPLSAVFFLKQATEPRVEKLSPVQAVERFLPVSSVPWYSEPLMTPTLKTLETIVENIPAYDLHFTKTDATATLIEDVISKL